MFSLTPGQAGDAPAGRELLRKLPDLPARCRLLMDCAYEGNETRQLALDLGFIPARPAASVALRAVEAQEGLVPTSQRDRAAVPSAQGFSPHLQPLRQARRHVYGTPVLRSRRRNTSIVLTGPSVLIQKFACRIS